MRFINRLKNTVHLEEIDKNIPFLGEQEQTMTADDVKKSELFQSLCVSKKIEITGDCTERIEQNLFNMQKGLVMPAEPMPISVSIKGHFFANTGYGKANRNLAFGLARKGCKVHIDPINKTVDGLNEMEIQQVMMLCRQQSEDDIVINSSIPTFAEPIDARYSILYTTVEGSTVPQQFVDACQYYNEVWTTTPFCRDVLQKAGLSSPVYIVPNAVNHGLYNLNAQPHVFVPKLKSYVFVSVFGWNYRKGYDALIKSYCEAFNGNDNVSLLIVTKYNYDESGMCKVEREIKDLIAKFGGTNPPHIARIGRSIPEFEMPRLYRACNAFVLPSRGEGFGLPYMEASLCGLPVIATNHSGHTMFLNKDNANLVEIDDIETVEAGKTNVHYWDGQLFPKLTSESFIQSLSKTMKDVYRNHEYHVKKNENLRQEILSKYTLDKVAETARSRLETIWTNL